MFDELVAHVPAESLVLGGGAPVYERDYSEPAYIAKLNNFDDKTITQPDNFKAVAQFLIKQTNIASKKWIYEQYDSMVQIRNMVTNAPADAALIRVKGTDKALSVTVDCNGRYVYANPFVGAQIGVAEAARNVVCSGGVPLAITNNLNFGNPYNPEVYWQFVMAVKGMGEACKKFDTPVTGGNVSFYNQSSDGENVYPVYPTPTIGMLGLVEDVSKRMTLNFKNEGDAIYLLGTSRNDINSSEYLVRYHKVKQSPAPYFNLEEEYHLQRVLQKVIQEQLVVSAHDVSDGGLFVTIAESAFPNNLGFSVKTNKEIRKDAYLFGESQSRVVVSVIPSEQKAFEQFLQQNNLPFENIGTVTKENFVVDGEDFGSVAEYKNSYNTALENYL
jgi:phosphoribosylformylglycinamidine synthase